MFDHMLVPLDGSSLAECVLPHTVAVAKAFGSRLTLLQVLQPTGGGGGSGSLDPLGWHIRKAEAGAYLDGVGARLQEAGLRAETALSEGRAAERIIDFARTHDVDLIVLSSHGRSGLSEWNISGVVQKILLSSCTSTMLVRAYQPVRGDLMGLQYRLLLLPLDGSQRAECVLPPGETLARFYSSRLLLVHVVCKPETFNRVPAAPEDIEVTDWLTERNRLKASRYLERLRSRLSADVHIRLSVSGNVSATLHGLVTEENVDLILLSAHGSSGGSRWPYGSVALSFIVYGTTPLLIVQDLPRGGLERTPAAMATREYKGH